MNWTKSVQNFYINGQEVYHYGVGGKQWSAIVFIVFKTFLNDQTEVRYGSKRVRNTLKRCSKSGQPGVTMGSARGRQGVNQGSLVYFHTTLKLKQET